MGQPKAKQSSISGFLFCSLVSVVAGVIIQTRDSPPLSDYLSKEISYNKPYETFEQFYPHYLQEHSHPTTRIWHYVGTSLFLVYILLRPGLIISILTAGFAAYSAVPFLRHFSTGLIEAGILLFVYLIGGKLITKSWLRTLIPMFLGYTFAWIGHFFVEMNKPATFIYPTYSLMGDFRMMYDAIRG